MHVPDAATVRRAFVNSSRSRAAAMNLPAPWPPERADDLDFLGWTDPKAPLRAYLVLESGPQEQVVSVELRLPSTGGRTSRKTMCDVCRTTDSPDGAVLVVAPRAGPRGRSGDSVGICLCADFGCSLRARQPLKEHEKSLSGAPDTRVADVASRITAFVDRVRS